jgi:hypothetical protein
MFIIDVKLPENPNRKLQAMLTVFEEKFEEIPPHFMLLGTLNPKELESTLEYLLRLMQHPTIPPALFAFLRLHIARHEEYQYCIDFNTNLLKSSGYNTTIIKESSNDIAKIPFDKNLKLLADKAVKSVLNCKDFNIKDLVELHESGWEDSDFFDAANHCGFMLKNGRLISTYMVPAI